MLLRNKAFLMVLSVMSSQDQVMGSFDLFFDSIHICQVQDSKRADCLLYMVLVIGLSYLLDSIPFRSCIQIFGGECRGHRNQIQ